MIILAPINCICGESICHANGQCKGCGEYRMLPRELRDGANAIEKATDDFKEAVIAWMNTNNANAEHAERTT